MTSEQIVARIRLALERIENPQYDQDYDRAAIVVTLAMDAFSMVGNLFDAARIGTWKTGDESTFDRFCACLYKLLQSQNDYLSSINPELLTESNYLHERLTDVQQQLAELNDQKDSILVAGAPLFAELDVLRDRQAELRELQKHKSEAEAIAAELAGVDLQQMSAEIVSLETTNQALQAQYEPLQARRDVLETEAQQLRQAIQSVGDILNDLENARSAEMAGYMETLKGWLHKLATMQVTFQTRVQKLHTEVEAEAAALETAMDQFREKLAQIQEYADQTYAVQEEMAVQFSANQQILQDVAPTLAGRQEQLEQLKHDIKTLLEQYDQSLTDIFQHIDATHANLQKLTF